MKILYGAVFVLVIPGMLVLWARAADRNVTLATYGDPLLGIAFATCGLALILAAMWDLWALGGGLPMNAFPPPRLVTRRTFAILPHPIYTGFIAVCTGLSMLFESAAGLWLVTPTVVAGCTALVLGYERPDLEHRFGRTLRILPAAADTPVTLRHRIHFLLFAIIPWLLLYGFTVNLRLTGTAFALPFEDRLSVLGWTTPVYQSIYIVVALSPWLARTDRELRRLMISAWVSTALIFPFYWLVPSAAPRPPLEDTGILASLLRIERDAYPPTAAFPSFHVLWAVFVARLIRPRWFGICYAAAVSLSCVTTGMHYIADVVAALAIAPLFTEPGRMWRWLRRASEVLANSWKEWRIGPVRIINHALYAGLAGAVQMLIVAAAVPPNARWKAILTGVAGILGAGVWAQWVEGSSRLRRPFGFYGGLIAVGVACLFFDERWTLLAAHCLAAPWMQAIGRLRCFVNGCCHGGPAPASVGIRVTNPRSRVTRLAELSGVPIHPAQLYSILTNVALGLTLARLWHTGSSLSLICGVYAIGNGLARFVEEAYRGEPQTPVFWKLRLYQWLAIASVAVGIFVTSINGPAPPPLSLSIPAIAAAALIGLLSAAAMGVDFPESDKPFARLT
ncbi:MAG TPA: prolipoprotein diacylglyceryl transferase family protein [Tepidiformaceae bacterium]|nr:prolipoprotein diacylglyceryl transferase family protein [Tepidiformaceae bacterium]